MVSRSLAPHVAYIVSFVFCRKGERFIVLLLSRVLGKDRVWQTEDSRPQEVRKPTRESLDWCHIVEMYDGAKSPRRRQTWFRPRAGGGG